MRFVTLEHSSTWMRIASSKTCSLTRMCKRTYRCVHHLPASRLACLVREHAEYGRVLGMVGSMASRIGSANWTLHGFTCTAPSSWHLLLMVLHSLD